MAETDARRARIVDALAVLVCAALSCVYLTRHFLDADEALFAAIGLRMRTLGLPAYDGGWEHKPPAVFWVYEALTSPWSRSGLLWVHAAAAAAWVATAVIAGVAARRLFGRAGFAAAVLVYALLRSTDELKGGAANTEAFLGPFLAVALLCFVAPTARPARAAILGGVALGVAVLFKPPVALYGPAAVAAVAVLRGRRAAWTCAWGGACGAAAAFGATAAYLAAQGVLGDAWKLTVDANRVYMESSANAGGGLAGIVDEPLRVAAPWTFALIGCAFAVVRPRTFDDGPDARRWAASIAFLVAAGVAAVSLGGVFLRHYWQMVDPVLAVAAAAGVVALLRAPWRFVGVGVLVAVSAALWLPSQWTDKRRLAHSFLFDRAAAPPYEAEKFHEAADAIRRHAGPDDFVFVWGANPELCLLAERTPASRHVSCLFLAGTLRLDVRAGKAAADPDVLPGAWDRLWEDFEKRPPRVVVDTSGGGYHGWNRFPIAAFPRLASYVAAHYALAETAGGDAVYVRRD